MLPLELNRADLAVISGSLNLQLNDYKVLGQFAYADLFGGIEKGVAVPGHAGCVIIYETSSGQRLQLWRGRRHLYQGYAPPEVQRIVDFVAGCGTERLLMLNAAGGISPALAVGQILLVDSIRQFQIPHQPDRGLLDNLLQEPFTIATPMTELLHKTHALTRGTYAALLGPNYETLAEINTLYKLGCSVVGMSTYLEALAAKDRRLDYAVLSVITNSWAAEQIPSHAEVLEQSRLAQHGLVHIIDDLITKPKAN